MDTMRYPGRRRAGTGSMGKDTERISIRLVVGLTAVFLLCLWAFVAYWSLRSRDLEVDSTRVTLVRLSTAAEEQVRRMFKLVEVFLDTADLWLLNHPQADPLSDPQFSALVQGFYRASGNAIQLRLVKRDGSLYRIPADGPEPNARVCEREYVLVQGDAGRRGFYIGAPGGRRARTRACPVTRWGPSRAPMGWRWKRCSPSTGWGGRPSSIRATSSQ